MENYNCIELPLLKLWNKHKQHTKLLQILLQYYGYNPGTCDGIYGPKTETAVKAFNKANKISAEYCTLNTWLSLLDR